MRHTYYLKFCVPVVEFYLFFINYTIFFKMVKLKTRQEIALEMGVSPRTLSRRIKEAAIQVSSGLLTMKDQELIRALFVQNAIQ